MKGARSNLDWVKVSGAHYEQGKNLALRYEAVAKEPRYCQNRNCATPLSPTRLQLRPRTDYRVHRAVRCLTSLLAPPFKRLAARGPTGVVVPPRTPARSRGRLELQLPACPARGVGGGVPGQGRAAREGGVRGAAARAPPPAAASPSPDVNWDPFPLVSAILDSNSGQRRRRAR